MHRMFLEEKNCDCPLVIRKVGYTSIAYLVSENKKCSENGESPYAEGHNWRSLSCRCVRDVAPVSVSPGGTRHHSEMFYLI